MATTFRHWLPDTAFARRDLGKALAETVAAWSARWFAQGRMVPLGRLAPGRPAGASAQRWRVSGNDIGIGMSERSGERLALLTLGAAAEDVPASPEDRAIVTAMLQACTEDLCRRLTGCVGLGAPGTWSTPATDVTPSIADPQILDFGLDPSTPLLQVAVGTDLIVAFAKAGLPPPPERPPLGSLAEGLAAQPLRLAARLGRCTLTLADFAALGEGDILVLEGGVDARAALAIDGPAIDGRAIDRLAMTVGTCIVGRAGDALNLTLLDQPLT